jgi:hypothetical protein
MPEVIFRGVRCVIQYEGEALRVTISPLNFHSALGAIPMLLAAGWFVVAILILPLEALVLPVIVLPIIGGSLILGAYLQASQETIILCNSWLSIESGFGDFTLFRLRYHLEQIHDLKIARETHYWCWPRYNTIYHRTGHTYSAWISGALSFRSPRRTVRFGNQLDLESAEAVLDALWHAYARCHRSEANSQFEPIRNL